jgi:hypothetical protein
MGNNGTAVGGPTYSGDVHPQTFCTGAADSLVSLRLNDPGSPLQMVTFAGSFPFNTPGDATIAFWIKSPFASHGAIIWGRTEDPSANYFQFFVNTDHTFGFNYREPEGTLHCLGYCEPSNGIPVTANQWTHLAVVRQGNTYRAYKNGVLAATQVDLNTVLPNSTGWGISSRPDFRYLGLIDDLKLYSRALTPREINPDPVVTQPTATRACLTGTAAFSITASGTGPFTYHWQRNEEPIDTLANPSAATPELTLSGVQPGDAASYQCVVTNACGSVTSSSAPLLVDPADLGIQGGLPGRDGVHDNNDFIVFINYFFAMDARADLGRQGGLFGPDGLFNNNDFIVFIDQFFAAC